VLHDFVRHQESVPVSKRRLLGSLLEFHASELQVQTQVIAATAAGVAAECSSSQNARAEAENAVQFFVALVENAIVILMFVEDHLRLQRKRSVSHPVSGTLFPLTYVAPVSNSTNSLTMPGGGPKEAKYSEHHLLETSTDAADVYPSPSITVDEY
ncbi:hypothetical protein Droror1_Dr00002330, partial [Drosera rotundifolia]